MVHTLVAPATRNLISPDNIANSCISLFVFLFSSADANPVVLLCVCIYIYICICLGGGVLGEPSIPDNQQHLFRSPSGISLSLSPSFFLSLARVPFVT